MNLNKLGYIKAQIHLLRQDEISLKENKGFAGTKEYVENESKGKKAELVREFISQFSEASRVLAAMQEHPERYGQQTQKLLDVLIDTTFIQSFEGLNAVITSVVYGAPQVLELREITSEKVF